MSTPTNDDYQPTVLIVEDDELARDTMARILVKEGYLVATAASGHDAMGLLHTPLAPIDVVLLDVHLPDVSGIDLCARIRQMHPGLPIVVCTGEADPDEGAQLLRLGIHRYFLKPMSVDELLATVEQALNEPVTMPSSSSRK
jgi:DNA-binding response OmpR family regulator